MEELKKKIDEVLVNVTAAQKRAEDLGQKVDKQDGEFKKLSDNAAKLLEEVQGIKQKQEAEKAARELLEKSMFRSAGGSEAEKAASGIKARDEFTRFMRKGVAMGPEVVEDVAKQFIDMSFIGLSEEQKAYQVKALIAGVNPQGGYFIRPELSAKVVKQMYETSPMRTLCDVVTSSSDILEMIIDDDEAASGGWVGETGTRSETDTPDIGLL